jgi:hypothetical protein
MIMSKLQHRWLPWTLGSVVLLGMSAYPLATQIARAEDHEHNPRIHKAIIELRHAREELSEAKHDYHGKKKEALEAVDKALDKLEEIKELGE